MTRTESSSKLVAIALAAIGACAVFAFALVLGPGGAEGKKKKGKKKIPAAAVVLTNSQHEILTSGRINVKGGRGKVVVLGNTAGTSPNSIRTTIPLTTTYKAKGKRNAVRSAQITAQGREALQGCDVDVLTARSTFTKGKKKSKKKGKKGSAAAKKKGKKKAKKRTRQTSISLLRDRGICSVGSENPIPTPYLGDPIDTTSADRCDFLDPAVCLQPWPNDVFTIADPSQQTGRRLNLNGASLPANDAGIHIDPTDYNRADGFSPGNMIVLKVPQVQTQAAFDNSGIVPINNLRRFDDDNQPVVVINAKTGERQPIWVELDANPLLPENSGNVGDVNLIIRPARNFEEGTRYLVALRNLRDANGDYVEPPLPFRVYRDRLITGQAPVEERRPHIEDVIANLQQAGVARSNLYMAWDFTTASEQSLSERILQIRDDAFDELGDFNLANNTVQGSAPTWNIPNAPPPSDGDPGVTDFVPCGGGGCGPGESDFLLRQIDGTLTDVPCYLNRNGCPPGSQFNLNADGTVDFNDAFTTDVPFRCIIPRAVVQGGVVVPARPASYGHGLLGDRTQVNSRDRQANQHNFVFCAVDWAGFSSDDIGVVASSLRDLTNFKKATDRMQQGFVNFMYLGRAMIHPSGFNTDPAFQIDPDGAGGQPLTPVIDTQELFFEGISQGAVMGGGLTAVNPDFTRGVLNVNGMNYSTLLRRSVDFDEYAELPNLGLYDNYPNELERPLVLSVMQLLWDRGETNGYAHHVTDDPLPDTPRHQVLLQTALGDHQVANITSEVEARTIGAKVHTPALDPGRHWEAQPLMGIPAIGFGSSPSFVPFEGSALVYYDGGPTTWFNSAPAGSAAGMECSNGDPPTDPCQGSGTPPNENVPPREENGFGKDPHGYPRRSADGLKHVNTFLRPDGFILPCTTGFAKRPCYGNGWKGP